MGFYLRDAGKQNTDGRQVAQDGFQLLADGDLRPRAGLLAKIDDRPGAPVNVLGFEQGGVGLRGAGFLEQFQVQTPFNIIGKWQQPLVLRQRDTALGLRVIFRPEARGHNRDGKPAQAQSETMQTSQVKYMRWLGVLHDLQEIGGGGFQQGFVPDRVKAGVPERAEVTLAAAEATARLHLVHDGLPGAQQERGITGRELGAGQLQIEEGTAVRLVGGFDQLAGGGLVACAQTLLLAGGRVL